MATEKPPAPDGKSGGKPNRRRPFRGRRRDRRPGPEGGAPREQAPPPRERQPEKSQDKAQRERRERRRRRRLQTKQQGAPDVQVNLLAQDEELNRPSPPVVVYTHVIRPDVRDSYEFRSEHFSKVTRRLEDFHIDLAPYFRSVEEEERRAERAAQRALAGDLDDEDDADDWDDAWDEEDAGDETGDQTNEPASELEAESGVTLAQSPTVDELDNFSDTDPDAGDEGDGSAAGQ